VRDRTRDKEPRNATQRAAACRSATPAALRCHDHSSVLDAGAAAAARAVDTQSTQLLQPAAAAAAAAGP